MDTLLGIPLEGWKALSIWALIIILPWTYGLFLLRRIDRSGVARWGAKSEKNRDGELGERR